MNWQESIERHCTVFQALKEQESQIEAVATQLVGVLKNGGRILIAGNGGSAADAQHFAAELTGRFVKERQSLAGIALTTDTSALTAIGNDYGFDEVFARQLQGLARKGDAFVGISTSGNSPNVIRALDKAEQLSLYTLGLLGRDGGKMRQMCTDSIVVPSDITANIQEAHIFIIHYLCAKIDAAF